MGWSRYDKLVRGQIVSVDTYNNKCLVRLQQTNDEVNIDLSFPFISSSSGIKFMPRAGDSVLIAYTVNNIPVIVGFELPAYQDQTYKTLASSNETWYRNLQPGDVLMYGGRGDSEVFISNNGQVTFGSGANIISLDPIRRAIEGICGSFKAETFNGVTVKGGYVSRSLVEGSIEQVIPNTVEFGFDINGLTGKIMEMKAGNVISDLGIPEVGVGGPKLFSIKTFAGLIPIGEMYIDTTTTALYNSAVVDIDAPVIRLGGILALQPAVLGTQLVTALTAIISQIVLLAGAVEPRSGQEGTVVGVIAQLQAMIPGLNTMLSTKVKLV